MRKDIGMKLKRIFSTFIALSISLVAFQAIAPSQAHADTTVYVTYSLANSYTWTTGVLPGGPAAVGTFTPAPVTSQSPTILDLPSGNIPDGYTFYGWVDPINNNFIYYKNASGFLISTPITLYPVFIAKPHDINYLPGDHAAPSTSSGTATLADNTLPTPLTGEPYNFSETIGDLTPPGDLVINGPAAAAGYQFDGWLSDVTLDNGTPGGVTKFAKGDQLIFKVPDSSVNFTAQWKAIDYKIHFDAAAGSGGPSDLSPEHVSQSVDLGGLTTPTEPTPAAGYTFAGWTTSDTDPAITVPTKIPSFTMPAKDVTLTANYTLTDYGVAFDLGGKADPITTLTGRHYGDPIGPIADPTNVTAGYTFTGWTSSGAGISISGKLPSFYMPSNSVTLIAQYSQNPFTITTSITNGTDTITPTNSNVTSGSTFPVTFTAGTGRHLVSFTIDSANPVTYPNTTTPSDTYTFTTVTADHSISVVTAANVSACPVDPSAVVVPNHSGGSTECEGSEGGHEGNGGGHEGNGGGHEGNGGGIFGNREGNSGDHHQNVGPTNVGNGNPTGNHENPAPANNSGNHENAAPANNSGNHENAAPVVDIRPSIKRLVEVVAPARPRAQSSQRSHAQIQIPDLAQTPEVVPAVEAIPENDPDHSSPENH